VGEYCAHQGKKLYAVHDYKRARAADIKKKSKKEK
jgi:hypothetical protein